MAVFRQGVVAQTSESRQEQRQARKVELVTRGLEAGTMSRLTTTQMAQLLVMWPMVAVGHSEAVGDMEAVQTAKVVAIGSQ